MAEQGWKKLHEKRIEAGILSGWQLWRNVYAADNDPYQFITIDWYNNMAHSLADDPEGFWENEASGLFSDEEGQELWEMTMKSRTLAGKDVMHRVMEAENASPAKYIIVNRMKVKDGDDRAYLQAEDKYSKPLQEASIEQMLGGPNDMLEKVFPGMTFEEWAEKVSADRIHISAELWELVDSAFPTASEE